MTQLNSNYRVVDPVLTEIIHGYAQGSSIAPFLSRVVPVQARAGKIVQFTKEAFAVTDTRRAPGQNINRIGANYTNDSYFLTQHAIGAEVTIEEYEEAINGEAKLNLRTMASNRAMSSIMQSWEQEVIDIATNGSLYEPGLDITTAAADQFSDPGSDPEVYLDGIKEQIRAQVGTYPTRMVIDAFTYRQLKRHPIFRDRVKYTSRESVNLANIAAWFDLPGGIVVSQKVKLADDGTLVDFMPKGTGILFYDSRDNGKATGETNGGQISEGSFLPDENADKSEPSAFYTYQLQGYPIAAEERFDDDRRVYVTDVVAEQRMVPVGLGATGKIGAAALISNLVAA